jgi:RNA polymerase sigma-70 factor (ECF subfamily)
MSDRDDILAAQSGDAGAFERLVRQYQRLALGHARVVLGRCEDARDAVQDAFVSAWRHVASLDPDRPFYPWFYVVLRNRCTSMLRKRRPSSPIDERFVAAPMTDVRATETRAALARLPSEDREILMLKYIDRRRYAEIAMMLDIPKGTVASRLHAARNRLAELIQSDEER